MEENENTSENTTMNADIQKKLSEFNRDPKIKGIKDYYTKKSFIEILSKSRNETTHSAFLGWLLQGEPFTKDDSPLLLFLDMLIMKMDEFNSKMIDDSSKIVSQLSNNRLKAEILARTLNYSDVKVTLEQTVKEISTIPSKDRLDIYLTAKLNEPILDEEGVNKIEKKFLRVIIENKVFSEERKAGNKKNGMDNISKKEFEGKEDYKKLNQTQRYYRAVQENPKEKRDCENTFSIYIFLTPDGTKATDNHFIPVTYQDIMDYVLEPLVASTSIDDKTKLYLEEYIKALSVPSISDTNNELTVLAVSKAEKDNLEEFWMNNNQLITNAVKSNNQNDDFVLQ